MKEHDNLVLECLTAKTFSLPENMKEAKRKTFSITGKGGNGRTKACASTTKRPKSK